MKLTAELVAEARRRVRAGETTASLSREWGASQSAVWAAVRGKNWGSGVSEPPLSDSELRVSEPAPPKRELTEQDVKEGRLAHREGEAITSLAERLGVSYPALYQAVKGISWKHLLDPPPVAGRPPSKGRAVRRRTLFNRPILASEVEALREAVLGGSTVAEAWRSVGLKEAGTSYAAALDAVRGHARKHAGQVSPVEGPLKRGRPSGLPPSPRVRPPLLQEEDVREARRLAHAGDWAGVEAVQARVGGTKSNLMSAVRGVTWAHLSDSPPFLGRKGKRSKQCWLSEGQVADLRNLLREGHTLRCAVDRLGLSGLSTSLETFRRAALGAGGWAALTEPPPFPRSCFKGAAGCCLPDRASDPEADGVLPR